MKKGDSKNYAMPPLNAEESAVILHKATEAPFSGIYTECFEEGVYICRQCALPLYESSAKFHTHCGWASFDTNIEDSVNRLPDSDGIRTEIVCAGCNGHLGHVFEGEGFTDKNTRHCVNSLSLRFVKS